MHCSSLDQTGQLWAWSPISLTKAATLRQWLTRLQIRLAFEHSVLPPDILVEVNDINEEPVHWGGTANILRAVYCGRTVALKQPRASYFPGINLQQQRRVSSRHIATILLHD